MTTYKLENSARFDRAIEIQQDARKAYFALKAAGLTKNDALFISARNAYFLAGEGVTAARNATLQSIT